MVNRVVRALTPTSRPQGFSLIEVLVVLAIVSIALLSVTLQTDSAPFRNLESEKKRLGILVHALSERASILGRTHKVVFGGAEVSFFEFGPLGWRKLDQPPFESRSLSHGVFTRHQGESLEMVIDGFGANDPTEVVLGLDSLRTTISFDAFGRWR